MNDSQRLLRKIRLLMSFFILGLFASGVTAIPLFQETSWLAKQFNVP
jgi:hypothetical protein